MTLIDYSFKDKGLVIMESITNPRLYGNSGFRDSPPTYARIQNELRTRIASGEWRVGHRLPTEKEIARLYGTSRSTVQFALSRLVNDGWIVKRAGRGTFVASVDPSIQIDVGSVHSFEDDAARRGETVTYRLLSLGRVDASPLVARTFGLRDGAPVMALERLRLINDVVIGHELRYFSPELKLDAPIHAFETESTHHLLTQRFSVVIGRIDATITAVIAPPEIAARMGVTATTPLLVRVHTIFAKDGTAVVSGSANYLPPYAFRYSAAPAPVSSLPLNP